MQTLNLDQKELGPPKHPFIGPTSRPPLIQYLRVSRIEDARGRTLNTDDLMPEAASLYKNALAQGGELADDGRAIRLIPMYHKTVIRYTKKFDYLRDIEEVPYAYLEIFVDVWNITLGEPRSSFGQVIFNLMPESDKAIDYFVDALFDEKTQDVKTVYELHQQKEGLSFCIEAEPWKPNFTVAPSTHIRMVDDAWIL